MPDVPEFSVDVSAGGADAPTRVAVTGEIDLVTSATLAEVLREQLAAGPVLLDLAQVVFLDSSGVRMLDDAVRAAAQTGTDFAIDATMQPPVTQVLELTGMLEILPIAGDREGGAR